MRLEGGRTAKRAIVCEGLELTDLTQPFDLEVWFGERLAVLGANGSGKSHLLRLLALGGSDPDIEHQPVGDVEIAPRQREHACAIDPGGKVDAPFGRVGARVLEDVDELERFAEEARATPQAGRERAEVAERVRQ